MTATTLPLVPLVPPVAYSQRVNARRMREALELLSIGERLTFGLEQVTYRLSAKGCESLCLHRFVAGKGRYKPRGVYRITMHPCRHRPRGMSRRVLNMHEWQIGAWKHCDHRVSVGEIPSERYVEAVEDMTAILLGRGWTAERVMWNDDETLMPALEWLGLSEPGAAGLDGVSPRVVGLPEAVTVTAGEQMRLWAEAA